jgi:hypothetical protein
MHKSSQMLTLVYRKVVLNMIYNFVVNKFFIWSHLNSYSFYV